MLDLLGEVIPVERHLLKRVQHRPVTFYPCVLMKDGMNLVHDLLFQIAPAYEIFDDISRVVRLCLPITLVKGDALVVGISIEVK